MKIELELTEPQAEALCLRIMGNAELSHKLAAALAKPLPELQRTDELETLYDLTTELAADLASGAIDYAEMEDSRSRLDTLIEWANEFNRLHASTDWAEVEYLDTVDSFYTLKATPYREATAQRNARAKAEASAMERTKAGNVPEHDTDADEDEGEA
jgi:hypothetical protein